MGRQLIRGNSRTGQTKIKKISLFIGKKLHRTRAFGFIQPVPPANTSALRRQMTVLYSGRVQGVGYRYFVEREARRLGVTGYTRNLDDGRVEVYAVGTQEQLSELAGLLRKGPRWADVRGVEEREEAVRNFSSFQIRH